MSGWGAGVAGASRPRGGWSRKSYAPGAVVSEVARRHDMSPQHLFGWRNPLAAELYEVAVKIRRHDGIVQTVLLLC